MTIQLSDAIVCGELFNTSHYSVHGWLGLKGYDRPVMLNLTGNPSQELCKKRIRFEIRDADEAAETFERPVLLEDFAWQQIGPTGEMTVGDNSIHLEWFSQNGRVVVDLQNILLEFIDPGADPNAPPLSPPSDALPAEEVGESYEPESSPFDHYEGSDEEDPYGLFPPELEEQFENDAFETDCAIGADGWSNAEETPEASRTIRELELMDDLIEGGEGEIIADIFDDAVQLPKPVHLTDEIAEPYLKRLLAALARFGITLDVCEHFTPLDSYRLLLEEVCVTERAYPELRDTQWVQHFMTSEYCPKCEEEFEREFEEYEQRRGDASDDYDDDMPF